MGRYLGRLYPRYAGARLEPEGQRVWAFYPKSGIAANRETCKIVKGCKHPVAARILADWTVSTEFQHAGWYQDKPGRHGCINRWNITKAQYLALYCGGVSRSTAQ